MGLFDTGSSTQTTETTPPAAAQARLNFILQLLQLAAAQGGPGLGGGIAARMRGGAGSRAANPLGSPEAQKALANYMQAVNQPGATTQTSVTKAKGGSPSLFQDLAGLLTGGLLLNQLLSSKGTAANPQGQGGLANMIDLLRSGMGGAGASSGGPAPASGGTDLGIPASQLGNLGSLQGIDFNTQGGAYTPDETALLFPNGQNTSSASVPWWNFWS